MSSPQDQQQPIGPVEPIGGPTATAPGAPFDPNAGAAANITAATTVASMQELKQVAPKVYDAMMMGIAMTIINQSRRAAKRLKEIIREGTRSAQGK